MFYNFVEDDDTYIDISVEETYNLVSQGIVIHINYWDDNYAMGYPFMTLCCNNEQSLLECIEDADEAIKEGCRVVYQYSVPKVLH